MNAQTHDAPMGVWQNGTMPQSVLTMRGSGGDPIVVTCATSSDHQSTPQAHPAGGGNSAGSSSLTCSSERGPLCHAVPPHATLTCSRTQVATLGLHWIMHPTTLEFTVPPLVFLVLRLARLQLPLPNQVACGRGRHPLSEWWFASSECLAPRCASVHFSGI